MDLKIIILSEESQTKKEHALYLYNILEHANEPIVTESRSSGYRCVGTQKGWRKRLRKGMGKFLEIMDMFTIFIVVMVSWLNTCHNLPNCRL